MNNSSNNNNDFDQNEERDQNRSFSSYFRSYNPQNKDEDMDEEETDLRDMPNNFEDDDIVDTGEQIHNTRQSSRYNMNNRDLDEDLF